MCMKTSTKILLALLAFIEGIVAVVLYNLLASTAAANSFWKFFVLFAVVGLSLGIDALIIHYNSAQQVSEAKKLKSTNDYIKAFEAWLWEDTPFTDQLKIVLRQLESLKRKQAALRTVLDDTKDSPFLTVADDVNAYILANCKRILNRVMIFDRAEPHKFKMHVAYMQEILGENAHMLSDFENLILEVSQIGDDANAPTPCLTEMTNALRQVRSGEVSVYQSGSSRQEPETQQMMQQ